MDDRPTCLTGKTVAVTGETVAVTGETLPAFAGVVANAGSDVDAVCFFR